MKQNLEYLCECSCGWESHFVSLKNAKRKIKDHTCPEELSEIKIIEIPSGKIIKIVNKK